jgi:hypothetical protein
VDLDRDGWPDIVSGSWTGELFLFRGQGPGKFGSREELKDRNGNSLRLDSDSTAFAADWRRSGKLDLVVGTREGHVYLIPNEGTRKDYAFGRPYRLVANGQEIRVRGGYSHPVVADWDRDGKLDLLVGTGAGSVLWYRNISTGTEPKLEAPRTLVPESPQAQDDDPISTDQWGTWAKICVTDWNGDGWPDLLLGDYTRVYGGKPKQTEAEKTAEVKARAELRKARKEREALKQRIPLLAHGSPGESRQGKTVRETHLQEARARLSNVISEIEDLHENIDRFRSPQVYHHGYVWLFLRKPPLAPPGTP